MNTAPSLYERMRARVEQKASNLSLARARIETQDTVSSSLNSAVPVEKPQVTTSTPCPHVTDPVLAESYRNNPKLTCARCWLERRGRPIEARSSTANRTGADSGAKGAQRAMRAGMDGRSGTGRSL
jgi:hypothetical protein